MKAKTCLLCACSFIPSQPDGSVKLGTTLICRRNPPTAALVQQRTALGQTSMQVIPVFVPVADDGYCAEFRESETRT